MLCAVVIIGQYMMTDVTCRANQLRIVVQALTHMSAILASPPQQHHLPTFARSVRRDDGEPRSTKNCTHRTAGGPNIHYQHADGNCAHTPVKRACDINCARPQHQACDLMRRHAHTVQHNNTEASPGTCVTVPGLIPTTRQRPTHQCCAQRCLSIASPNHRACSTLLGATLHCKTVSTTALHDLHTTNVPAPQSWAPRCTAGPFPSQHCMTTHHHHHHHHACLTMLGIMRPCRHVIPPAPLRTICGTNRNTAYWWPSNQPTSLPTSIIVRQLSDRCTVCTSTLVLQHTSTTSIKHQTESSNKHSQHGMCTTNPRAYRHG